MPFELKDIMLEYKQFRKNINRYWPDTSSMGMSGNRF